MNWKLLVEKNNAKKYVLPDGWTTREKVAEQLECSPERVAQHLSSAIKEGVVEASVFPVWDKLTKRIIRVTAYRETTASSPTPSQKHRRNASGRFAAAK